MNLYKISFTTVTKPETQHAVVMATHSMEALQRLKGVYNCFNEIDKVISTQLWHGNVVPL